MGLILEFRGHEVAHLLVPLHRHALECSWNYSLGYEFLAWTYEAMGNYKQAMEQWTKLAVLAGDEVHAREGMEVFEKSGYKGFLKFDAKAAEALGKYGRAAGDYALLEEKDAAFAALEKAFAKRSELVWVKARPDCDNIRSDPRFADLLRRMGLP